MIERRTRSLCSELQWCQNDNCGIISFCKCWLDMFVCRHKCINSNSICVMSQSFTCSPFSSTSLSRCLWDWDWKMWSCLRFICNTVFSNNHPSGVKISIWGVSWAFFSRKCLISHKPLPQKSINKYCIVNNFLEAMTDSRWGFVVEQLGFQSYILYCSALLLP